MFFKKKNQSQEQIPAAVHLMFIHIKSNNECFPIFITSYVHKPFLFDPSATLYEIDHFPVIAIVLVMYF